MAEAILDLERMATGRELFNAAALDDLAAFMAGAKQYSI
jgi:hypothetical protein